MQIKIMVQRQWRWQELGVKQLTATHGPHGLSAPWTKLNFQIYIKTGQALWDMISRYGMITDLPQPALNKMQKDLVCSQLPKEWTTGNGLASTYCLFFSRWEGSTRAWRKADLQWIPLRLIYPCKNTSSTLWRVSPPKCEQGAAMRQQLLPWLLLPTCWTG